MKEIIDGYIITVNGKDCRSFRPNLFPVIQGFGEILGKEKMNEYLHECFDEGANFYPCYSDIGLGNSKGWARPQDQINFINFIMNKLSIETGYEYKGNIGRYDNIICE